jgi:tetratricopeptide (TPR) repeat protein
MKARVFLFLGLIAAGVCEVEGQTTNSPPPPASPPPASPPATNRPHVVEVPQPDQSPAPAAASTGEMDPAKVAEYQKRFEEGYALQGQGKLAEARAIYDSILADQPEAKRSLLEAGRVSFELGDDAKADEYLEKLHEIVPDFPEAIELLIQINQALKRDVRVELLTREFTDLRSSGKVAQLTSSLCFVRERISRSPDTIVVSQFFDYTQDPNTVWMAEVFDATGQIKRRLLLNYDPDATRALRAKDAKYGSVQVFTWFEHVMTNGHVTAINAYLQIFALPDYNKFRSAMLILLANPPKPIYSTPVDEAGH